MTDSIWGQGIPPKVTGDDLHVIINDKQQAQWATEKTLKALLAKIPGKDVVDPTEVAATAALAENTKAVDGLTSTVEDVNAAYEKALKANKDGVVASNGLGKAVTGLSVGIASHVFKEPENFLANIGGSLKSTGSEIAWLGGEFKLLGKSFVELGVVVEFFGKTIQELFKVNKVYLEMYDTGLRFNNGMEGMIEASIDTGLGLEGFTKALSKSNTATAVLSDTAPLLIKRFQDVIKKSDGLSMSLQQGAESFMDTVEIFQNTGQLRGMSDEQVANSSHKMLGEINQLSAATGISRKAMLDNIKKTFEDPATFAFMKTLPDDLKKNFAEVAIQAQVLGPAAGMFVNNVKKFTQGGGSLGLLDDNFRLMLNQIPGMTEAFAGVAKNPTDKSMKSFLDTIDNASQSQLMMLSRQNPEFEKLLGEVEQARQQMQERESRQNAADDAEARRRLGTSFTQKAYEDTIGNINKEREDAAEKAKKIQEAINNSQAGFNTALDALKLPLMDIGIKILPYLTDLANIIRDLVDEFVSFDRSTNGLAIKIVGFTTLIGGALVGLLGVINIVKAGMGAISFIKTITGAAPAIAKVAASGAGAVGAVEAGGAALGGASLLTKGAMGAGKLLKSGSAAGLAATVASMAIEHFAPKFSATKGGSALTGALSGAGTGAMMGAILGPGGALAGAALGGIIGGIRGYMAGGKPEAGSGAATQESGSDQTSSNDQTTGQDMSKVTMDHYDEVNKWQDNVTQIFVEIRDGVKYTNQLLFDIRNSLENTDRRARNSGIPGILIGGAASSAIS